MIINTALLRFAVQPNILASGIKILELCKLSYKAGKFIKEDHGMADYLQQTIEEGDTIADVGSHQGNYIYLMRKKLKESGKIIAFGTNSFLHEQLVYLKKIFDWKNVHLEFLTLSNISGTKKIYLTDPNGAVLININDNYKRFATRKILVHTLDDYFNRNNIRPDLLKIDADGNELKILQGAVNTLMKQKPKILLKCEERIAGARKVMDTLNLLTQLGYKGHFFLDSIRIPLVNFDFNIYQNPCNDFYCSHFVFE
ncbi:MAG: FkbM family methyltransferase [Bacteroidota bacterium]|nr:FkbM family methyltransferase [Bacteroidota bacterium]